MKNESFESNEPVFAQKTRALSIDEIAEVAGGAQAAAAKGYTGPDYFAKDEL